MSISIWLARIPSVRGSRHSGGSDTSRFFPGRKIRSEKSDPPCCWTTSESDAKWKDIFEYCPDYYIMLWNTCTHKSWNIWLIRSSPIPTWSKYTAPRVPKWPPLSLSSPPLLQIQWSTSIILQNTALEREQKCGSRWYQCGRIQSIVIVCLLVCLLL